MGILEGLRGLFGVVTGFFRGRVAFVGGVSGLPGLFPDEFSGVNG